MSQNTAMVLTPPGTAAIAVVRLRGPGVEAFLQTHFSRPTAEGRCAYGMLRDGARVIDDAIVLRVDESTADLNLHGGSWVVQTALDLARREGFELFSASAGAPLPPDMVDADSVLEGEVLSHLPLARTELGAGVLLSQVEAWRRFKLEAAEAPNVAPARIQAILADLTLHYLLYPPRVAIVGLPNVGKSTLANQLFGRERSITADAPGTTRDWVGEIAEIDGLAVLLVDTPGLRESDDAIEQAAIAQSADQVKTAERIVLVLDASRPLDGQQAALLAEYPAALRVINKCDLPCRWDIDALGAIRASAVIGRGADELRKAIVGSLCGSPLIDIERPRCWTDRQRAILHRSLIDPTCLSEI